MEEEASAGHRKAYWTEIGEEVLVSFNPSVMKSGSGVSPDWPR